MEDRNQDPLEGRFPGSVTFQALSVIYPPSLRGVFLRKEPNAQEN
jgi:hypothetical protein